MAQPQYTTHSPLLGQCDPDTGIAQEREKEIPNGGISAWLQVLAGHLAVFNAWGYIASYGFFQEYLVQTLRISPASASLIGSTQMCLAQLLGFLSGRAADAGHHRTCIALGCSLQVFGVLMTSFGTEIWHFWLTVALCTGVGHGLVFSPMISLYSSYFTTKRVMAVSLASAGTATGGMVFPTVAYFYFDRLGFAWTVRLMALIIFVNSVIIISSTRLRVEKRRQQAPWIDFAAFSELSYTMFSLGSFLVFAGTYFAYIYVRQFAQTKTHFTNQESLILLLSMNGIGLPSRVLIGILADHYLGPLRMCALAVIPCGIIMLSWIAVHSHDGMFVWALAYGLVSNCALSLIPASGAYLGAKNPRNTGARVGLLTTINSVPLLIGPYIAGKLIAWDGGEYLYAQLFGGLCILTGSVFIVVAGRADALEARRSKVGR